jgi:pilus assembly protein CpaF
MTAATVTSATGLAEVLQHRRVQDGSAGGGAGGLRTAMAAALRRDGGRPAAASLAATTRPAGDDRAGLGPLAPLLADPAVTDVLVNGPGEIWVERDGRLERVPLRFASSRALAALVQRVVAPLGLRIDEARPWVDARLQGGERFHAVLPPLAPDGPIVTIRTFSRRRLELADLVGRGALDDGTGRLLEGMVAAGVATVVSGATGSGKTTLLNVLGSAIPNSERVVTVEDAAELRLPGPHVVRLEARPPQRRGSWRGPVAGVGPQRPAHAPRPHRGR